MFDSFIESDTVELKEVWVEAALSDLAAFSNTRGGTLFIGVADAGRVVGCDASDIAQQTIGNKIRNMLNVTPEIRVQTHQDKPVLAVTVPASKMPVLLRGSYWVRMGTVSIRTSPNQWFRLVLKQTGMTWEGLPAQLKDPIGAIDRAAVSNYIRQAQSHPKPRLPLDISPDAPLEIVLGTLGLLAEGEVNNAALLAFGTNPSTHYQNAVIRIARFRGSGVNDIREFPWVQGRLLQQIEAAVDVVDQFLPRHFLMPGEPGNLDGKVQRREILEYPISVVREAITNAVIHRDYISTGVVKIRILDDRFEIWNPGTLEPPLTLDKLYGPHSSVLRNPVLAKVCFNVHDVEAWGTGTTRMVAACEAAGFPRPEFAEDCGGFVVTLRRDTWSDEAIAKLGLNERQQRAIPELRANGVLTLQVYRRITGCSRVTAYRDLSGLAERGLIESIGSGPATYYVLKRRTSMPSGNAAG